MTDGPRDSTTDPPQQGGEAHAPGDRPADSQRGGDTVSGPPPADRSPRDTASEIGTPGTRPPGRGPGDRP